MLQARVDGLIRGVRSLPPAAGFDRVWLPGEMEWQREVEYRRSGVPLPEEAVDVLQEVARVVGLQAPEVLR